MSKVQNRIVQEDLVNPTLLVLASIEKLYDNYDLNFTGVYSTKAREAVISAIEPMLSDEDKQVLKGRKDTKIDQTFRNLISHQVLKDRGLVSFNEDALMRLTELGYKTLVDYFNERFKARNMPELAEKENYKSTLYSAFNDKRIPVKNAKIEQMHDDIKNIIKKRTEKKQVENPQEEVKAKPKRILKMGV